MVNPSTPGYFARFLHQMAGRGGLQQAPQYAFSVDRNAGLGKYPGWKCHLTLAAAGGAKIVCSFSSNSKKNAKQGAAHEGFVLLVHHLHETGRLVVADAPAPAPPADDPPRRPPPSDKGSEKSSDDLTSDLTSVITAPAAAPPAPALAPAPAPAPLPRPAREPRPALEPRAAPEPRPAVLANAE